MPHHKPTLSTYGGACACAMVSGRVRSPFELHAAHALADGELAEVLQQQSGWKRERLVTSLKLTQLTSPSCAAHVSVRRGGKEEGD
jgi:hypothetical protein